MSLKMVSRMEMLDWLIRTESTGVPAELAARLGVSERTVYDLIEELKELGAPIGYSRRRLTYYYTKRGGFCFKFMADPAG